MSFSRHWDSQSCLRWSASCPRAAFQTVATGWWGHPCRMDLWWRSGKLRMGTPGWGWLPTSGSPILAPSQPLHKKKKKRKSNFYLFEVKGLFSKTYTLADLNILSLNLPVQTMNMIIHNGFLFNLKPFKCRSLSLIQEKQYQNFSCFYEHLWTCRASAQSSPIAYDFIHKGKFYQLLSQKLNFTHQKIYISLLYVKITLQWSIRTEKSYLQACYEYGIW